MRPSPIAAVQTALPAFVGYTERADVDGQPAPFRPTLIDSLAEFQQQFGGPPMTTFDAVEIAAVAGSGHAASWTLVPDWALVTVMSDPRGRGGVN